MVGNFAQKVTKSNYFEMMHLIEFCNKDVFFMDQDLEVKLFSLPGI